MAKKELVYPDMEPGFVDVFKKVEEVFNRGSLDFKNLDNEFNFALGTDQINRFLLCKTAFNLQVY